MARTGEGGRTGLSTLPLTGWGSEGIAECARGSGFSSWMSTGTLHGDRLLGLGEPLSSQALSESGRIGKSGLKERERD